MLAKSYSETNKYDLIKQRDVQEWQAARFCLKDVDVFDVKNQKGETTEGEEEANHCETQLQVSISWVALYSLACLFVRSSPWWHLHLSPPYDVLDHTNHVFSESLSSGDHGDEDLQKDKKTKNSFLLFKINLYFIWKHEFVLKLRLLCEGSSFDLKQPMRFCYKNDFETFLFENLEIIQISYQNDFIQK